MKSGPVACLYIISVIFAGLLWLQLDLVDPTESSRCPASAEEAFHCLRVLNGSNPRHGYPTAQSMVFMEEPPTDLPYTNERVIHLIENFNKLGLPLHFSHPQFLYMSTESEKVEFAVHALNVTFGDHLDVYSQFPGGAELYEMLTSPQEEDLLELIQAWAKQYIDPNFEISIAAGANQDGGLVEQDHFFSEIASGHLILGNHHDLISHLFLYADPKIRELTRRLTTGYARALQRERGIGSNSSALEARFLLTEIFSDLWRALQETPLSFYRDQSGRLGLSFVGGLYVSADPFGLMNPAHLAGLVYHWNLTEEEVELSGGESSRLSLQLMVDKLLKLSGSSSRFEAATARFVEQWTELMRSIIGDSMAFERALTSGSAGYPFAANSGLDTEWRETVEAEIFLPASEQTAYAYEQLYPGRPVGQILVDPDAHRLQRIFLADLIDEKKDSLPEAAVFSEDFFYEYMNLWLTYLEALSD